MRIIKKITIWFWGIPVNTEANNSETSNVITNLGKGKNKKKEDSELDTTNLPEEKTYEKQNQSAQESKSIKKLSSPNNLGFTIGMEQISGKGEDGPPLLLEFEDRSAILSVADGMGGAGGTVYDIDNTKRSGAYLASNIVTTLAENYFINFKEQGLDISKEIQPKISEELKYHFDQGLQQILDKIDKNGNIKLNIKSKLIKRLPTTFALSYIKEAEGSISIYNYWAGDSRIYSLHSKLGLNQLTEDNLVNLTDAYENLLNDSKISNCINADTDYKINSNFYHLDSPQIIFASTDGAFGYLPTPVHFEYILLDSLIHSSSEKDWKQNLKNVFKNGQSDDISVSLRSFGFRDFDAIKNSFKSRFQIVSDDISKLNNAFHEINSLEKSLFESSSHNEKLSFQIQDYQGKIDYVLKQHDRAIDGIKHFKSEINSAEELIKKKMSEIDLIRNDINAFHKDIDRLTKDFNATKDELEYLKNKLSQFKNQNQTVDTDSMRKKLDSIKETRGKLNKELWLKYKSQYEKLLKDSKK